MLDYNKLLDDWSEETYRRFDKALLEMEHCKDKERYRFLDGYTKGILEVKSYLALLENRKRDKYLIINGGQKHD